MKTIWQALIHTPWWVYLLLAYVIKVGLDASRPRTVSLFKIFIIPIIFSLISLHTLITCVNVYFLTVTVWVSAIILGAILGLWEVSHFNIQVDRGTKHIHLPGTWSTLIVILIFFAAKYFVSYELAVDPRLLQDSSFELIMLSVSGVCAGFFVGRLIYYLYVLKASGMSLEEIPPKDAE